ncbi:hypothetical protein PoB_004796300 [Plakobranchus ocellatus]|uniref:Uncharacterized protein n=1 Tax=Plakobranchus ocellatus TaxID=259542 RepID=A0AAV4BPE8_9GAST|nr:hypothetical protein PoB_004796300 [Plakobranchus ocellatus]
MLTVVQWMISSTLQELRNKWPQNKKIKVRSENPFTIDSLCDLIKKNRDDIEKCVTFELPQTQTGSRDDLADMKGSIALCNEKNASFLWDDTRPKHVGRRTSLSSDGRHVSSTSLFDGDRRHRQHHSGFVKPLGERRT